MDTTQTKYHELEVSSVLETITSMSNPFDVDENMINIANGKVAKEGVSKDMTRAREVGEQKCTAFISENLLNEEPDLFAKLKATKLNTFTTMNKIRANAKASKGKVVELRNHLKFVTRLLAVRKARNLDMMEVLTHSLRKLPSLIAAVDGKPVKTPKAKLLHILEDCVQDPLIEEFPENNALILDGMAIIQATTRVPETFGDLVESILSRILSAATNSKSTRVDFVCDTYPDISIKNLERSQRANAGSTMIMILGPHQKVPRQFKKFLSVGKNKEALIEFFFIHLKNVNMLSTSLVNLELFISHGNLCDRFSTTITGEVVFEKCSELCCDHEEADTRLLLHARHASTAHDDVIIRSPDTDIFILMLGHKPAIPAAMYFDTGVGNYRRILDVNKAYLTFGRDLCNAIIGFHAFTGCDSTSAFYGKGKSKTLSSLEKHTEFFAAFKSLGSTCTVTQELFQCIQKYICVLYGQLCDEDVNISRFNLFSVGQYSESTMPCTKDVLLLHVSRSSYQAYIWKCALQAIIFPPSIDAFGWEIKDGQVLINWKTMAVAPDGILGNANCGCKSGCSTRQCACVKAELKCTGLCGCNSCVNIDDDDNTMTDDDEKDEFDDDVEVDDIML